MENKTTFEIDWEEQWKTHSPGFKKKGCLTIPGKNAPSA